jgi:putative SOS response-associated peptidase YedK
VCGRFTLTADPDELRRVFSGLNLPQAITDTQNITPRYNIAPTQPVMVIANDGRDRFDHYLWGLIPSWAKDPEIGNRMINARAETLAEKPAFRSAFRRRRCLIPASGFYEWKQEAGRKGKTPMYIKLKSGESFAFAGLWESWNSPDGSNILSCTIITTTPNELMQSIHNRMPVILPPEAYGLWLTPRDLPAAQLQPLLKPYPAEEMTAYPVSTLVNSPVNDVPECIAPVAR